MELPTEAMEAHFFTPGIKFDDAQILSSAASVRVSSEAVQKIIIILPGISFRPSEELNWMHRISFHEL